MDVDYARDRAGDLLGSLSGHVVIDEAAELDNAVQGSDLDLVPLTVLSA